MADLDLHEQRQEDLRDWAVERLRNRRAYRYPALRRSELPEGLSPLRGSLRVGTRTPFRSFDIRILSAGE